jgi:ribose transport system ATP-binding protein
VQAGEVHAVVGENGAGKSTLMKIVAGVIGEYDGEVLLHGQRVKFKSPREAEVAGISIIHQELNSVPQLTVSASLFLGREITGFAGVLNEAEMKRQASRLLEPLDASISPNSLMGTLRIGDQQLVEIARALALQPAVLVMDEPALRFQKPKSVALNPSSISSAIRARRSFIFRTEWTKCSGWRIGLRCFRDGRFVDTVAAAAAEPRQIGG